MRVMQELEFREFNHALVEAMDEVIGEMLGRKVLKSLYTALETHYDVTKDEIPYRIETAYKILKDVFGVQGSTTISNSIVRRLYQKLGLDFEEIAGIRLMEYVEIAKRKLATK
jgi:hypothetical protein